MQLKDINFKRKITTIISLISTILLIALFVVGWIFLSSHIIYRVLLIFLLLACLYCLSKFYVYETYLNIKYSVISLTLVNKIQCKSVYKSDKKNDYIYRFYNKKDINIKSSFVFSFENFDILVKEFYISQNKKINNKNISISAKYLKIPYNYKDEFALVLNYDKETNKYIEYFSYLFDKKKEASSNKNKQYLCLYKEKFDLKTLELFDKISNFHMLSVEDGYINIIYFDDKAIFDFKIQKNINSQIINLCHESYEKVIKIIKCYLKWGENNV